MNTSTHLDILSLIIFIGLSQGIIISLFFIFKPSTNIRANRYQGLLMLVLSLCILEQVLNRTGYIVKVLFITNTTEPLNLVIGPLLYLFIKRSIEPAEKKNDWVHFILFLLYLGYMCLDYVQTNEFKYNSYLSSTHPDWQMLDVKQTVPDDPLNIKSYLNLVTAIQILFYISLSFRKLMKKVSETGETLFRTNDEVIRMLRNTTSHIFAIILIFIIVKLNFRADLGDYFIGTYVAFFAILTTFKVMNDSEYFDLTTSFMDISISKYRKSSLTEAGKNKILENVIEELEKKQYFADNLASLSDLAKKIGESSHHVSQVINEKLNKSFFELLATYRVEEAKRILIEDLDRKLTVEEISEMVGYNSKTAFNNSFKKITGQTPSEFRKSASS